MGGYFICNGIERIIRMLIQQRRHYIMGLRRSAYHKRGKDYTDAATLIRYKHQHHCKSRLERLLCTARHFWEAIFVQAQPQTP